MSRSTVVHFKFSSPTAQKFFECSKRNILWISGYGAGKTYAACQKILALMLKFPGYRVLIGRENATELKRTTVQTFFKVCPKELYDEKFGGKRIDGNPSYVQLINGSRLYWMHLAKEDESALRSLEINAAIVDQAEEIAESTYLILNVRCGRWDEVEVPQDLLNQNPDWPRNEMTGRPMAPTYVILLANPPDEGEFSYLYTHWYKDSELYPPEHDETHELFVSASGENKALPAEVLEMMLRNSQEWVDKYVYGKVTAGGGAIHRIHPASNIVIKTQEDLDWLKQVLEKSNLTRTLDHGATSPTCCLWWASYKGYHICYREYYVPNKVISYHRQAISDLSKGESYVANLADPSIFRKEMQKFGGFWSVADEYLTQTLDSPQLFWGPADNNEFATRNRINEFLGICAGYKHPLTGEQFEDPITNQLGAPRIYYIRKSELWPNGCSEVVRQTASQKKKELGEVNGEKIYSDERDDSVTDHAYDPQRYYIAAHLNAPREAQRKLKHNSFRAVQNRIKAVKKKYGRY